VAREVQVPRGAKTRTREEFEGVLSPAEQSALLAASYAGGGDLGDMVAVAMGAGLRRRELLSLEGGHVDVGARQVVIRFGGKGGAPTKSGKPRRVPLFGVAWRALEGRAAREGVCFPSRRDGARTKVPRSAFLRAVQAAGIGRPIRWHDLRHTCATSLLMGWWGKAWTLTEVQAFLGHADQATTERYIHVRPELVFRAAEGTSGPRDARETLPLNENGARLVERDEAAGSKGS
jgi:integrase